MARRKSTTPSDVAKKVTRKRTKKVEEPQVETPVVETPVVEEPKIEAAPAVKIEEKAPVETVVPFTSKPVVTVKPNMQVLNNLENYLKSYKSLGSKPVPTHETRVQMINQLSIIVRYILANMSNEVLERFYKFFVDERSGLMAETEVFQASSILPPMARARMEAFYTVFACLVRNKLQGAKFPVDLEAVRSSLGSDLIVEFIARKLGR